MDIRSGMCLFYDISFKLSNFKSNSVKLVLKSMGLSYVGNVSYPRQHSGTQGYSSGKFLSYECKNVLNDRRLDCLLDSVFWQKIKKKNRGRFNGHLRVTYTSDLDMIMAKKISMWKVYAYHDNIVNIQASVSVYE